ncbi:MAG: glycosyltransferase [Anaerolineae bacterium]
MAAILILTPQVPYPPRQGTALRNWGLLQGLAAHHEVSLLTFASPDQASAADPTLTGLVERVEIIPQPVRTLGDRLRGLLTTQRPDLTQRLASERFADELRRWLDAYEYDWLIIEGLEMAPYLAHVPDRKAPRVVFDDHNCEYLLQKRAARADWRHFRWLHPRHLLGAIYSTVQWRRLQRYEAAVCQRADIVIAVSKADAAALGTLVPGLDPLVVPNGIDVDSYASFDEPAELEEPAFVFTGTMDFRPNVDGVLWFVENVWPKICEYFPSAHFYIVGRNPHPRLEALQQLPGIIITGGVPDTRPYIQAATVYVVPLLVGGGTRLKILESAAMSKAIVATALAAEGFPRAEDVMILADSAVAFSDACIALARDPLAREAWGKRAYAFAEAYDWTRLLPPLLDRLS